MMAFPDDFLEIDFLAVETGKSGDAITIRSARNGVQFINVVDGGFTEMGATIIAHLDTHYTNQSYIDNVVLTHPDGDHARGLRHVLENRPVARLWMNRPWLYAAELLPRFKNCTSVDWLRSRLRSLYPNVAALEDIASEKGIPIYEAFQGTVIGHFIVMAPSRARYLDLIVESDRTPEAATTTLESALASIRRLTEAVAKATTNLVKAAWGQETFSASGTSPENEMSLVQFANFGGLTFLLTGDAGQGTLAEAADYAPYVGLSLPGIDRFQVPHHGSRRNVSTELLDRILGERLDAPSGVGCYKFEAIISSAEADPDHPRKSVERAMHHRGGKVIATEGSNVRVGWQKPDRGTYGPANSRPYPEEQEE